MDFEFSEEQIMIRNMVRDFAEKEIAPTIEQDEKEHRFRPELVKKMAELGFFGCVIPDEYGGNGAEKCAIGCYFYGEKGVLHVGWKGGMTFFPRRRGEAETGITPHEQSGRGTPNKAAFNDATKPSPPR